jgi:MerR family transcriptional regulator/heat shock protein HspR
MNKKSHDTEPRYVISVAARMLDTQTYTLRYYEKVGIIEPRRSRGNVRLYSDRDIALLQRVKALVDDMGVNLPGVEVILRMMEHRGEMQRELEQAQQEIDKLRQGEES